MPSGSRPHAGQEVERPDIVEMDARGQPVGGTDAVGDDVHLVASVDQPAGEAERVNRAAVGDYKDP